MGCDYHKQCSCGEKFCGEADQACPKCGTRVINHAKTPYGGCNHWQTLKTGLFNGKVVQFKTGYIELIPLVSRLPAAEVEGE